MERRHFLKLAFGFAAGGIALAASAQAAPLMPAPLADDAKLPPGPDAQPAVTSGEEVDRLTPEEVDGAAAVIAAGAEGVGAGVAGMGLAPPPFASPVLGLASPPSLAPPLLAPSSLLLVSRRQRSLTKNKKSPARAGLLSCFGNISKRGSVHSATRCRRGTATGPHHDDRSRTPERWVLDKPERPGDWARNHHRGRDASRAASPAASAALKLATVPRAKTAAKKYFMFSPVLGRKRGTVRNLVTNS